MRSLLTLGLLLFSQALLADPGLCQAPGNAKMSAYDLRQLVKIGATVRVRASAQSISAYDVRSIAKEAAGGGKIIVCADSNNYSAYDLRNMQKAGAQVVVLQ